MNSSSRRQANAYGALTLTSLSILLGCHDDVSNDVDDAAVTVIDAGTVLDANVPVRNLPLIDHFEWQRYDAGLDPLAAHQPANIVCPATAAFVEYDSFEVDTARCNYVLSWHPAIRDVAVGTTVQLTMLHYDLLAAEPATAHLAIFFDDVLQWQTEIPIPSSGRAIHETFTATRALRAGEPIRFHLHNHGGNTWLLHALDVVVR
jgi:hypothetical protein